MPRGGRRPGAGRKKKDLTQVSNLAASPSPARIVQEIPEDALDAMLKTLPPDVTAHELLKAVIQSPQVPGAVRLHAAAKVLPFEVAKPQKPVEEAGRIVIVDPRTDVDPDSGSLPMALPAVSE